MATLTGTRATTLSLALVTGAALFSPSVASAATPPTTAELQITGDFLAAQLRDTSNGLLSGPTGWTDIGLTADVIFALDALDLHSDQADRSYAALLDNADDFLYFDYGDGNVEADAGRLAKIVALQSTRGERTDSYVDDLVDTVQDDGKLMNEINGEPSSAAQNFSQAGQSSRCHAPVRLPPLRKPLISWKARSARTVAFRCHRRFRRTVVPWILTPPVSQARLLPLFRVQMPRLPRMYCSTCVPT